MWTMNNDLHSVSVGINFRIGFAKRNKQRVVAILLGRLHSRLFVHEIGHNTVPKEYYYTRHRIPVYFNVQWLYGIGTLCVDVDDKKKKLSV